jgi:hypothetical protein
MMLPVLPPLPFVPAPGGRGVDRRVEAERREVAASELEVGPTRVQAPVDAEAVDRVRAQFEDAHLDLDESGLHVERADQSFVDGHALGTVAHDDRVHAASDLELRQFAGRGLRNDALLDQRLDRRVVPGRARADARRRARSDAERAAQAADLRRHESAQALRDVGPSQRVVHEWHARLAPRLVQVAQDADDSGHALVGTALLLHDEVRRPRVAEREHAHFRVGVRQVGAIARADRGERELDVATRPRDERGLLARVVADREAPIRDAEVLVPDSGTTALAISLAG